MADTGFGATLVLGTSAFSAALTKIGGLEITRPVLDISFLAQTGAYRLKTPGDLLDAGPILIEGFFDPDEQPPISGAAETGTITFAIPSGGATGATLSGSMFCNKFNSAELMIDELMAFSFEMTFAANPTWADSA